jgi:hypothetical protein
MIAPDVERCRLVAERVAGIKVRRSFYGRDFLTFDADRETKLRVYLMSAAICHQTHDLHHPGLNLWGWDYMEHGFLKLFRDKHVLLNPGYLSICTEPDIEGMLLEAFSPDGNPENCTLDRIPERAAMLAEICRKLRSGYHSKVSSLIDEAEGRLIHNGFGLYESLAQFTAFSDPSRKKITFFIKLAVDAGVLFIRDPGHLVPIMDYHMQRVLLRMGCIRLDDPEVMSALKERKPMASDREVRNACIDAMRIIANESGQGILKMNDLFWPLGRSCCQETTLCADQKCAKSPCSFSRMIAVKDHMTCAFAEVCRGNAEEEYRKFWHPIVDTHYY